MNASAKPRLLVLDGMRGLAAMLVVLFHTAAAFDAPSMFERGYLAVDFFFLLSGFVLARVFDARMAAGGLRTGAFLGARLRRLWPVAAMGSGLAALVLLWKGAPLGETIGLLATTLLLLPRFDARTPVFSLNGPLWSLLFELAANGAHAAVLRRVGERGLVVLTSLAALALVAVTLHVGSVDVGHAEGTFWFGFIRVGFAYTCGVLIARKLTGIGESGRSWLLPLLLLPLSIVAAWFLPLPRAWSDLIMVLAVFPLLLVLGAKASAPRRAGPALSLLGAISFPLYAIHAPLLGALQGPGGTMPHVALGTFQAGFLAWALLVAVLISRLPFANGVAKARNRGPARRTRVTAGLARWSRSPPAAAPNQGLR